MRHGDSNRAGTSKQDLLFWLQEAQLLGRSDRHLATIQQAIAAFDRDLVDWAILPEVFMTVRDRDRADFYRQATDLMS